MLESKALKYRSQLNYEPGRVSLDKTRNEIWRPVKDYEDSYLVSNKGRTYSLPRWVIRRPNKKMFLRGGVMRPLSNNVDNVLRVQLYCNATPVVREVLSLQREVFSDNEIDFTIRPSEVNIGWSVPDEIPIDFGPNM